MLRGTGPAALVAQSNGTDRSCSMSMKLGFDSSWEIVQVALQQLFPDKSMGLNDPVEKVIPEVSDREKLAANIQYLLRTKRSAHIEKSRIPILGHTTFEELTREIVTWSALPGDPGTRDKPPRDPDGPLEDDSEEQKAQHRKKPREAES